VANIVGLGAIARLTPAVSPKAIETAVLARVPKGTEKLNRDALRAGMKAAQKMKDLTFPEAPSELEDEDT